MALQSPAVALADLLLDLGACTDSAGLLRTAVTGARRWLDADQAVLVVAGPDGAVTGWHVDAAGTLGEITASTLTLGRDVRHGGPDEAPEVPGARTVQRAWLAVPLATARQALGWLWLGDPRELAPADERAVQALAAQIALALEHLRLREHTDVTEARYRTLVEQLPAVTYFRALDRPGVVDYVSPQIQDFGYTPAEWLANPAIWFERLHPDDRAHFLAMQRERMDPAFVSRPVSAEYRIQARDGRWVWVRNHALAVPDAAGKPAYVLGVVFDITEEKQREEALRQAQRMDAVGRLAGGVAHDFNNLLTGIRAYADLLAEELIEHPALPDVEEIRKAADRATSLTQQLLAFSRRQVLTPEVLDVNAVVRDVLRMLQRLIGEDVEIVADLSPEPATVRADPTQLQQVLLNLALNARDAMPAGGRLVLQTRPETVGPRRRPLYPELERGEWLRLTVRDTGVGMDAETREHLFEPFFTTKERGKGTGLGLATVYGIVRQSHGHIFVHSEPGQGTTFSVYLPRVTTPVTERAPELPSPEPGPRGQGVVLVAEDEQLVRLLVQRVLQQQGYTVLVATDGVEALRVLAESPESIDLLLTDVVMPKMGGLELAQAARGIRPDLKVLYMSGYVDRHEQHDSALQGPSFLAKPFSPEQLAGKVRAVLAGNGDAAGPEGRA